MFMMSDPGCQVPLPIIAGHVKCVRDTNLKCVLYSMQWIQDCFQQTF